MAVVPLPIQLSRTRSHSLVYVLIRYSNKATGFCVGCTVLPSDEISIICLG